MAHQSITYNYNFFVDLGKNKIRRQLIILETRVGVTTQIYKPIREDTVYGTEDVRYIYADTPTETRKCLITSLLRESSKSLVVLDPFYQEEIMWYDTHVDHDYPQGTLLVAELGRVRIPPGTAGFPAGADPDVITFKVDRIRQNPGGSDAICKRYVLVQAS